MSEMIPYHYLNYLQTRFFLVLVTWLLQDQLWSLTRGQPFKEVCSTAGLEAQQDLNWNHLNQSVTLIFLAQIGSQK